VLQEAKPPHSGHAVRQNPIARAVPGASPALTASHSASAPAPAAVKILLTDEEGAEALGVSPRMFAKLLHEPWFPKPVVLGPRLKRHVRAELEAAVVNMPRREAAVGDEPAQLLRSRIEKMKRAGVPA
jgi:predicted DNA-binding transcriptional regulator AlpA